VHVLAEEGYDQLCDATWIVQVGVVPAGWKDFDLRVGKRYALIGLLDWYESIASAPHDEGRAIQLGQLRDEGGADVDGVGLVHAV
jgi:hypothetical protein